MTLFKNLFFLLIATLLPFQNNHAHELSICAIFQDEAPYLAEWIEYHRLVGVDHFYLYNDRSSDEYLAVLAPYINDGIVDLIDCPAESGETHFFNQRKAYARGLNRAKDEDKWLAIIDIDEFIVPKKTDTIKEMLKNYEDYYGVSIRWQKFGTSGYWEIPKDRLTIECLTKKAPPYHIDNLTKSIVQPKLLPSNFFDEQYVKENRVDLVHFCKWIQVNDYKVRSCGPMELSGKIQRLIDLEEAQINHYWCRDEKYYREKKVIRKAKFQNEDFDLPCPWPEEKVQIALTLLNLYEDYEIQRFVPALKERMNLKANREKL
ncbi:MAG TPA: glycosyltransferase family 92 protein [Chlamydiales bacterium]|nr:glycosyltransferase family 92 protein [Chlamydiales bacterium]